MAMLLVGDGLRRGLGMPYAKGDRVMATLTWARDADWTRFDRVEAPGVVIDVDPTSEGAAFLYDVRLDEPPDFRGGQLVLTFSDHRLRPEPPA